MREFSFAIGRSRTIVLPRPDGTHLLVRPFNSEVMPEPVDDMVDASLLAVRMAAVRFPCPDAAAF